MTYSIKKVMKANQTHFKLDKQIINNRIDPLGALMHWTQFNIYKNMSKLKILWILEITSY